MELHPHPRPQLQMQEAVRATALSSSLALAIRARSMSARATTLASWYAITSRGSSCRRWQYRLEGRGRDRSRLRRTSLCAPSLLTACRATLPPLQRRHLWCVAGCVFWTDSRLENALTPTPSNVSLLITHYSLLITHYSFLCFIASQGHDLVDATSERRRERTAEEGVPYPTAEISLVKPMTYMNRSGGVRAVAQLAQFLKEKREEVRLIDQSMERTLTPPPFPLLAADPFAPR